MEIKKDELIADANKNTLTLGSIIGAILILSNILMGVKGVLSPATTLMEIVLMLGLLAAAFILYKKQSDNKISRLLMYFGLLIPWTILVITQLNVNINYVVIPVIVIYVFYADYKITIGAISVTAVVNIITIVMSCMEGKNSQEDIISYYLMVLTFILFYMVVIRVTHAINLYISNVQNEAHIVEEARKQQQEISNTIIKAADIIVENSNGVNEIVSDIAKSSEVVGNAIQEIASGASKTAEDIQHQSKAVDNIQNQIESSAELVEQLNVSTNNASKVAENGFVIVNELAKETEKVNCNSDEVSVLMNELKEKSNDIASITSMISDIASQTNLLALNASIEAARAGEAGRGFSVVASEVGNLAEKSKEATVSINSIIVQLQEKANKSTEVVEKLVSSNEKQSELVGNTEKSFKDIMNNINEIVERNSNIKSGMSEIVKHNEDIVQNISNISAVSEQTMANTEETYAMAEKHITDAKEAIDMVQKLVEVSMKLKER